MRPTKVKKPLKTRKEVVFVRIEDGKPQVKFPGHKDFSLLTEQFATKSIEEIIPILKKLPANKGVEFKPTPAEPTNKYLKASDISQFGTSVSIRVDNMLCTVELNNIREAQELARRLRRFVKTHRVAVTPAAVQSAVETCAAIKVI